MRHLEINKLKKNIYIYIYIYLIVITMVKGDSKTMILLIIKDKQTIQ